MLTMQGSGNSSLIIQRYAVGLWPQIRGERPFIVRGPNWNGRHIMRETLRTFLYKGFLDQDEIRLVVAEWMLREGFCVAAWMVEMPTVAPQEDRWRLAIRQCADEIPKVSSEWPIHIGAWELLDGMSKLEHYKHLMWMDSVVLETMPIPSDNLTP